MLLYLPFYTEFFNLSLHILVVRDKALIGDNQKLDLLICFNTATYSSHATTCGISEKVKLNLFIGSVIIVVFMLDPATLHIGVLSFANCNIITANIVLITIKVVDKCLMQRLYLFILYIYNNIEAALLYFK